MTNIIQRFISNRSSTNNVEALEAAATKAWLGNVVKEGSVTRADFDKLATLVNTMAKAVEGLIEDMETATDPAKMQAVFNTALKDVMPAINAARRGGRAPLALPDDRSHLAPRTADRFVLPSDDDDGVKVNARGDRRPLALPADRSYLIPQGE